MEPKPSTVAAFKRECRPGRVATITAHWTKGAAIPRTVCEVRSRDVVFFKEDGTTRTYLFLSGCAVTVDGDTWTITFPRDPSVPPLSYTFTKEA